MWEDDSVECNESGNVLLPNKELSSAAAALKVQLLVSHPIKSDNKKRQSTDLCLFVPTSVAPTRHTSELG